MRVSGCRDRPAAIDRCLWQLRSGADLPTDIMLAGKGLATLRRNACPTEEEAAYHVFRVEAQIMMKLRGSPRMPKGVMCVIACSGHPRNSQGTHRRISCLSSQRVPG